jgi:hypothetical protein
VIKLHPNAFQVIQELGLDLARQAVVGWSLFRTVSRRSVSGRSFSL